MNCLKIVRWIVILFIGISQAANLKAAVNQVSLFNSYAAGSWKSSNVGLPMGISTIEQHLVREFNTAAWGPGGTLDQINLHIANLAIIRDYYQNTLAAVNPVGWTTLVRANWNVVLATDGTPRKWMDNLNLREIYRFKDLINGTPALLDNANYATDDLVKARSLSGIFWRVDTTPINPRDAAPSFSGMLAPGQNLASHNFEVYTCLHGFSSGNAGNNVAYYFVPYGVTVSSDPNSSIYVPTKGFKVTDVKHFRVDINGTILPIDNPFFDYGSAEMNVQNIYGSKDYAVATVAGQTATGGVTLHNTLVYNGPAGLTDLTDTTLPTLDNTSVPTLIGNGALGVNERLFIIGLSSYPTAALDRSIIAVSTNLTNETPVSEPRRSFRNDHNVKTPTDIGCEIFSSIANFPGTSGGPILRCQLDPTQPTHKRCQIVGTNWGAERAFDGNNMLTGFRSVTSKKIP